MDKFDDLGVSETIGYILVFAIVLTGIAGIVFFGVTMLNDAKDRNNFQNVEQGLTVVQSDMKRVALEKAPVKTSKLRVEGGSLALNFSASSIRVDFAGNIYNNHTGDITYDSNEYLKTVSIENGALWKAYGPMSDICIVSPRIFSSPDNNAIIINVIRLKGDNTSFAGAGTIGLGMEYVGNNVYTYDSGVASELTITVNTTYPNAWARFFEESPQFTFFAKTTTITENSVRVTISGVNEVVVSEHTIEVKPIVFYG